jgi:hypothetical protein
MFCCRDCGHYATCGVMGSIIVPCLVSGAVSSHCIWCQEQCRHTAFGVTVTVIVPCVVSRVLSLDCVVLWSWSPCCMQCQQCMQPRGACQRQHACLTTHCAISTISRGGCGPLRERAAVSLSKEVEGNDPAAEGEVSKKKKRKRKRKNILAV